MQQIDRQIDTCQYVESLLCCVMLEIDGIVVIDGIVMQCIAQYMYDIYIKTCAYFCIDRQTCICIFMQTYARYIDRMGIQIHPDQMHADRYIQIDTSRYIQIAYIYVYIGRHIDR